jgi:succinylglutamate desuccinylase
LSRIIADLGHAHKGNTLIAVGALHGNEKSGLIALERVSRALESEKDHLNGRFLALKGNLKAIEENCRYIDLDLNRAWTDENIRLNGHSAAAGVHELQEMQELKVLLDEAISTKSEHVFLADLHTTSGPTIPFLVTNRLDDAIEYTNAFPMPHVSGIEGYLDGTMLSYLNHKGQVGLAFEAGQHENDMSIKRQESFIWLSLYETGILGPRYDERFTRHYTFLTEELTTRHKAFTLIYRHRIEESDEFQMKQGYSNFQKVSEGEVLAKDKNGEITCPYDGFIFLPLYQKQGTDGFFIITPSKV